MVIYHVPGLEDLGILSLILSISSLQAIQQVQWNSYERPCGIFKNET